MQDIVLIYMLGFHNILPLTCKQQSKLRDGIFIIGYHNWKTVLHHITVKIKSFENHYLTHLTTLTHGLCYSSILLYNQPTAFKNQAARCSEIVKS